jgi:hypothetical protein
VLIVLDPQLVQVPPLPDLPFGPQQPVIPLPPPQAPLIQRQFNLLATNQQAVNQGRVINPRLLEDAAARQQAAAEAVTPQRQVINPFNEWLKKLTVAAQEMRSLDQFHTPGTSPDETPVLSPVRKDSKELPMHATGDQGLWNLFNNQT